jgi:AcrR family transcriptional regulator
MTTAPTHETEAEPVRRPRGRPRDPRVEGVVLSATREILLERGFGRLTIAAVADAAGVGKGTIYLRWPDKESLVVSALGEVWEPLVAPDTGTLRDDVLAVLRDAAGHMNGTPGSLLSSVVGEMPRHAQLLDLYTSAVIGPWSEVIHTVFTRGVERGEMRPDIDHQLATDALMGPLVSVCIVRGQTVAPRQVDALAEIFLRGVAA